MTIGCVTYTIVGVCAALYCFWQGWQHGDAIIFLLTLVTGTVVGVFWLPVGLTIAAASAIVFVIQVIMDMFRWSPQETEDSSWETYYKALKALDEEIYKGEE